MEPVWLSVTGTSIREMQCGLCAVTPRHNYFYMMNAVVKGMSVSINSDIHLTSSWTADPQFLHLQHGANDTCGYCEH